MCTMAINQELNGIELTFAAKPSEEIRTQMKAAGFRWHRMKKLWYARKTQERLELAEKLSENAEETQNLIVAPELTENFTAQPICRYGLKAGDILHGSWGYEQTNCEFWLVTKIVSACKIEIVELGHNITCDSSMSGYATPDTEVRFGDPVQKFVKGDRNGTGWHVKLSESCTLHEWDGQPKFWSAWA